MKIAGGLYDTLLADAPNALRFLYFLSSFFNQFGPNCTSFLTAAESYPTAVRAQAHGASAAAGKVGALVATAVFGSLAPQAIFWACAGVGEFSCVLGRPVEAENILETNQPTNQPTTH